MGNGLPAPLSSPFIWTTDAADGELAALKPILRSARKPVAVYLCRAVGGKVEAPVEWK
jgi:hypothetical protein